MNTKVKEKKNNLKYDWHERTKDGFKCYFYDETIESDTYEKVIFISHDEFEQYLTDTQALIIEVDRFNPYSGHHSEINEMDYEDYITWGSYEWDLLDMVESQNLLS